MTNSSNRNKFNEADRILSDLTRKSGTLPDEGLGILNRLVRQKNTLLASGVEQAQEASVVELFLAVRALRDKINGLLG